MVGDSVLLEIWLGWIFVWFEDLVWFSYNGLAMGLNLAVLCCRFGLVWKLDELQWAGVEIWLLWIFGHSALD